LPVPQSPALPQAQATVEVAVRAPSEPVKLQNQIAEIKKPQLLLPSHDIEPDYTTIPGTLDARFLALDVDSSVRATIIKPDTTWRKKFRKNILTEVEEASLEAKDLKKEKNKAFDLIDALSRSGALIFDDASFHVIIAQTHCFDKSIVNTIVQDNINPIEKVERSMLIVGTTLHQKSSEQLLKSEQSQRVKEFSPGVFSL